jgi:hypothetical protein
MRIRFSRRPAAHITVLAFSLLTASLAIFGQAPLPAQVASLFAGQWVEDQSQQKIGAERNLRFRNGADGLEELRGPAAHPLVMPVRFGTAPYNFAESSNMAAWKQLGSGHFATAITSKSGKTLMVRDLIISPDGKTLTEKTVFDSTGDKKSTTTIVYARTSGVGQDLEGVWKAQTERSDMPVTLSIQAVGNTLNVSPRAGVTAVWSFDGKPTALTGPAVITGQTIAGKIDSDHVIETKLARFGTPFSTITWTVSADGKWLTESNILLGPDASKVPSITVYRKQ